MRKAIKKLTVYLLAFCLILTCFFDGASIWKKKNKALLAPERNIAGE